LATKESGIVRAILEYLTLRGYVCKRNNSGMMFTKGQTGKTRGIKIGDAGWADIEGITPNGRYFGIEVKTPKGKLTPIQEEVGTKIIRSNGIWFVARSVQDVIDRGY